MKCNLKEGNVLFNDKLNTFHLWFYDIKHTVKDQSDSIRGNPLFFGYCDRVDIIITFIKNKTT